MSICTRCGGYVSPDEAMHTCAAKPTDEFARGVEDAQEIDVLERAYDWIKSAPHADECFTNDPNPDACCCVCGKDAMLEYLADPSSAPAPDTVGVPGEAFDGKWQDMPTYGEMPFSQLVEAVSEAIYAKRDIDVGVDAEKFIGHQMLPAINYNSLNRIVSAFVRSALLATPLQLDEDRSLRELGKSLVGIIEGINGTMNHGTFRGEKSGLRLKDTPEWVAFYVALSALSKREARPSISAEGDAPKSMGEVFREWDAQHGSGAVLREYESLKRPQSSEKET